MRFHTEIALPRKRKSPPVTPEMAAEIKALIEAGVCQHDIAAHYKINQGRVSEIATGMKFPGIEPAQLEITFH